MNTKMIDGKRYVQMLMGGAQMLAIHIKELNDLNVFPVADGDTGTNMTLTITAAAKEVANIKEPTFANVTKAMSTGRSSAA